jgi:hypothetical protein
MGDVTVKGLCVEGIKEFEYSAERGRKPSVRIELISVLYRECIETETFKLFVSLVLYKRIVLVAQAPRSTPPYYE